MRILTALVPVLLLLACGGKTKVTTETLAAPPMLPSPRAGTYTSVVTTPSDPILQLLVKGLKWDEALSGAAAGLALDWSSGEGSLTAWEAREAAWRAGWPWPLAEVRGWKTPPGAEPPEEFTAWLAGVSPNDSVGVVRARGHGGDAWVVLRSQPRAEIGQQPRQVPIGAALSLPVVPGAEIIVADPSGRVVSASLELERVFHADLAGEWLFEVRDKQGTIALFPVYAGMVPPDLPVLTRRSRPTSADEASRNFVEIFQEVRSIYGAKELEADVFIQSAAESAIRDGGSPAREVAAKLGYDPNATWRVECKARTLEACMDQLLWNPRARPALLAASGHLGLAAELVPDGIHVVALIAAR